MNLPKYVFRAVTHSGTVRYRLRMPGRPIIRLHGEPGTPEFQAAYERAIAAPAELKVIAANRASRIGTFDELIVSYYGSDAFLNLAPSTRYERRHLLERFRVENGRAPVSDLTTAKLAEMLKDKTPVNRNNWKKLFGGLFKHAIAAGLAAIDPSKDYKPGPIRSKAHARWSDDDIARFRRWHKLGGNARLAFEIFINTGLRKSDVVRLGPQHIRRDPKTGQDWIRIAPQKSRARNVEVELPIEPELAEALQAMRITGTTTFLVTKYGKPYTAKGFGNYMREWCDAAGLADLSGHGIRHTVGAQLAEAGANTPEIMSMLGHTDPRMSVHYTSQASRPKLAAAAIAKRRNAR